MHLAPKAVLLEVRAVAKTHNFDDVAKDDLNMAEAQHPNPQPIQEEMVEVTQAFILPSLLIFAVSYLQNI